MLDGQSKVMSTTMTTPIRTSHDIEAKPPPAVIGAMEKNHRMVDHPTMYPRWLMAIGKVKAKATANMAAVNQSTLGNTDPANQTIATAAIAKAIMPSTRFFVVPGTSVNHARNAVIRMSRKSKSVNLVSSMATRTATSGPARQRGCAQPQRGAPKEVSSSNRLDVFLDWIHEFGS